MGARLLEAAPFVILEAAPFVICRQRAARDCATIIYATVEQGASNYHASYAKRSERALSPVVAGDDFNLTVAQQRNERKEALLKLSL